LVWEATLKGLEVGIRLRQEPAPTINNWTREPSGIPAEILTPGLKPVAQGVTEKLPTGPDGKLEGHTVTAYVTAATPDYATLLQDEQGNFWSRQPSEGVA